MQRVLLAKEVVLWTPDKAALVVPGLLGSASMLTCKESGDTLTLPTLAVSLGEAVGRADCPHPQEQPGSPLGGL
jgi:hypothetical protein